MNPSPDTLAEIADCILSAESVLVVAGAGISAESGIPTYRGIGGLYDAETTEEGFAIEEVLSAQMLGSHPALTWKYLLQIGHAVDGAQHNTAHKLLAQMEAIIPRFLLLTQNVDGFHRDAGSRNLIEIHGNMNGLRCNRCDFRTERHSFRLDPLPPLCPQCQDVVRPDVVLFGELLDGPKIETMQQELQRGFDVVISVGTTAVFPYIQAPMQWCHAEGKTVIEINPSETAVSHLATYRVASTAVVALTAIWDEIQARRRNEGAYDKLDA